MTSYEMAILLAKALDSKKGQDIKVLKTEELTTLADYFVICTATSNTQIKAMSDACEEEIADSIGDTIILKNKITVRKTIYSKGEQSEVFRKSIGNE